MGNGTRHAPRSFVLFACLTLVAGLATQAMSMRATPAAPVAGLWLLVGAAILSENYALRLNEYSVSLSFPMVVAAIAIGGPTAGGVVAAASFTNLDDIRARRPLSYSVFNLGQVLTSASVGGWVYLASGAEVLGWLGHSPSDGKTLIYQLIVGVLAAGVGYSIANTALTSVAVHLAKGVPIMAVFRTFAEYVPTQFALSCVGLLVAEVVLISPWALPLFLFPLFLARQIYQRYASMRDLYVDTVRSLINALEAKDPYTRGHSERVSSYAVALGRSMGLDSRGIDQLEKSALLHDIGKLALAADVLTKPSRLSDQEMGAVRRHPQDGAAIIARIPPLRGLRDSVLGHHERFDGTGYPNGLSAADIPLAARILAVADAYDAMTTNRAYRGAMSRDEAIRELTGGAGTQFDPVLVAHFVGRIAWAHDASATPVPSVRAEHEGGLTT